MFTQQTNTFRLAILWISVASVLLVLLNRCSLLKSTPPNQIMAYDEMDVVRDFSYGLMQNDRELLQDAMIEDSWPKIDKWISNHQAVQCRNSLEDRISQWLDPSEGLSWHGSNGAEEFQDDKLRYDYIFVIPCRDRREANRISYSLVVQEIILVVTSDGWKVEGLNCIEESFSYTGKPEEDMPCLEF